MKPRRSQYQSRFLVSICFFCILESNENSARTASIANLAKLRDLGAMEREFTRDSLVSEFILPSILGSQPLEPQITADSVCPSIDCPRYQTCVEPEGQLIAVAFCDSICVADFCRNDAICTHASINAAPRCFCAGKGLKILKQPVGHEFIIKSFIHLNFKILYFQRNNFV